MSDASPRPLGKRVVTSPDAPAGTGPYSPALVVGDFVYVAGQGPLDPLTHEIRGATIEEQMRLTFKNMGVLLRAAGSSFESVVKVNVYLSDIGNYEKFNAIYKELFVPPYPVRTTVACILDGIMIEADCVAILEDGRSRQASRQRAPARLTRRQAGNV
jgi:2-iminobutanoate/2-iminopropanoate deaminase